MYIVPHLLNLCTFCLSASEGLILIAHIYDCNEIITVRVFEEHHQTA